MAIAIQLSVSPIARMHCNSEIISLKHAKHLVATMHLSKISRKDA